MNDEITSFLVGSVRLAVPLVFAATGEVVSQRAGVLNLSLEGMMLTGAFTGAYVAGQTGQPWLGVAAAVAVGLLAGLIQAVLSVTLGADQLVVGIAANALALGLTTYLGRVLLGSEAGTAVPGIGRVAIPLLSDIPFVGPALFDQSLLAYVGAVLVGSILFMLSRTGWGLAIRAAGEDARAADQAGLGVVGVRYAAVICAGGMAALGGAFLSLADVRAFTDNMTGGRGYLAVVAVIAGSWIGWRVVTACLIFGACTAAQFQAATFGIDVPVALLVMAPYVVALVAVAGLVGRGAGPNDLTRPFERAS